ncbi:uncharacterized protein LOC127837650 isoform X3 [Dreissena polymorpha]|uniref:Small ribosomal subunit protein mS40 n=1 Tax=Dreissena polymorpha TaxID=45954 RepID=A0A9D4FQ04_DREPO|nr:uncharacterized protein LOC127837650 isoform X1 [Dreissena polymorpha]XP_052220867.1 uncharacterized protein LOC127837650 isoform X2 [Dreissena polymorpha]XP_052220868.1 uncharacterized protein LOC127837650 isoform X3 [Dreissena polymorpha]KAH3801163.1 hypothetical protein DPMN_154809 [Dreissena polymorpha]
MNSRPKLQQLSRYLTLYAKQNSNKLVTCINQSSRQQFSSSCTLLNEVEKETKRPVLTDPEFEGRIGYAIRKKSVETCIEYMKSEAYKSAYGERPVWKSYRRNVVGAFTPKLRKSCIREGVIATGSACPICRDDYLRFHWQNLDLLKQFVTPLTMEPINPQLTGLCEMQYKKLQIHLHKARDMGTLKKHFSPRTFYMDYWKQVAEKQHEAFIMESTAAKEKEAMNMIAMQAGDKKAPQGGDKKAPQGGDKKAPQGGDKKAPQGGDKKAPQDGDKKVPQGGDKKSPPGGDKKSPQGGDKKAPQGGNKKA